MEEGLVEFITKVIEHIDDDKLDPAVEEYKNYKSRYVIPKPHVRVQIELTSGKVATIDITDYFKGVIK